MKPLTFFLKVIFLMVFVESGVVNAVFSQNDSMPSTIGILELKSVEYQPVILRFGGTIGFGLNRMDERFIELLNKRLKKAKYGDSYWAGRVWESPLGPVYIYESYPQHTYKNLTPFSLFADAYIYDHWTVGLAINGPVSFSITGYHEAVKTNPLNSPGSKITADGRMTPYDLRLGYAFENQSIQFMGGPSLIYTNFDEIWWEADKKEVVSAGFWLGAEFTSPQKKKALNSAFVLKFNFRWFAPTYFGGITQVYQVDGEEYSHTLEAFKASFQALGISFGYMINGRKQN